MNPVPYCTMALPMMQQQAMVLLQINHNSNGWDSNHRGEHRE